MNNYDVVNTSGAKKNKLYEDIVELFLARIEEGSLSPGDRLPSERLLAEDLGVSRTAIREALRSLEMMGVIESRVGEGTYIKAPSLANIVDPFSMVFAQDRQMNGELIEVRLILESETARLAARRRDDAQLSALRAAVEDMKKDIDEGGTGLEADEAFHAILAQATGNRALNTILTMCANMLSRTRFITQGIGDSPASALVDHTAIYEAVAAKDERKARSLMRRHLSSAKRKLQKLK